MKILIVGSGGREHALAWKIAESKSVEKLCCAPGNGGISQVAECVATDVSRVSEIADVATRLGADLTVIGPEQPLVLGVADEFAQRGLRLLGPRKHAAQLEGSKIFAKEFLIRHAIPTASVHGICESAQDAYKVIERIHATMVLKADGLCGGKGVLVTSSANEAREFVERAMEQHEFGEGGKRLMIEEALQGRELSYIVLADGKSFVPLVPTRDHKRVFDGDQGPNTGGMGAYSADGIIDATLEQQILQTIVRPTFRALEKNGEQYRGFLYFGLMLTSTGPKVLEFNCRLGDPETQPIVARMDFDLAEALAAATDGFLNEVRLKWKPGASICVVMASGGYPGKFASGQEISGLDGATGMRDVTVFHAGTKREGTTYYTGSGRVLGVTASGSDLADARRKAYSAVKAIHFKGGQYRNDIGAMPEQLKAIGNQ